MPKDPRVPPAKSDLPEIAIRVISSLYDTVAEGAPYEPMFFAMDEVIMQLLTDENHSDVKAELVPMFAPHFDRAAHVFDIMSRSEADTPLNFVEQQHVPTAVLDQFGRLVATNSGFDEIVTVARPEGMFPFFASPSDASRFSALAQANQPQAQSIINFSLLDHDEPQSFLAGQVPHLVREDNDSALLYIMLIKPRWTDKTGHLLQQAFGLTGAEVETMKSFVECGSVKGIAERRGRSIRTVRTQLSRVFAQMGISGQTELALFLATLSGMEPIRHTPIRAPECSDTSADRIVSSQMNLGGHQIEVYEYGAPDGLPVLLMQSSHPPELTVPLRSALFHAGLRIIAPLKPGSGKSEHIAGNPGPVEMAGTYAALLRQKRLDKVIVAGQASGGLYALAFARAYPAATHAVALIDTGVPFADRAEMMQLPRVIRRTMVPARYFPEVLYLPHKLVAANFHRSARGEESVVDYFFNGSKHDQELTRTDRSAYDVTRRIISYSFDDTVRLVQDVTRWANDWTADLTAVTGRQRLRFIQGQKNLMYRADKIADFVVDKPNTDLVRLAGGQLAVFEDPDGFVTALSGLR